ncbi:MAG: protein-L-isoaspartate O-methyltransferase family protein [Hyphomicrobiaceae bacterium]
MTDYATQRSSMVDSQVRPSDVTDRRIPRAMLEIPREAFARGNRQAIAYADGHLPLSDTARDNRVLLAPRLLAKLIQHLDIAAGDTVLDIGCGTGYSTAILARLARTVVAIEADAGLAAQAETTLKNLGIDNAKVIHGPHEVGALGMGPYDAILVNGAVADMPRLLLDQMKDHGRLAAVAVEGGSGRAVLWRRFAMQFDRRTLFDAEAPLLPGFMPAKAFVF